MTRMGSNARNQVRSFLGEFNDDDEWLDGSALFSGGLVDSLVAVELIPDSSKVRSQKIL